MSIPNRLLLVALVAFIPADAIGQEKFSELIVDPAATTLRGAGGLQSILVTGKTADGRLVDLTHIAKYQNKQTTVAPISPTGVIRAVSDGEAEIAVTASGL